MQCPNCGAKIKTDRIFKCHRCDFIIHKENQPKQNYEKNIPQQNVKELIAAPREVPAFLILACFPVFRAMIATTAIICFYYISKNSSYTDLPSMFADLVQTGGTFDFLSPVLDLSENGQFWGLPGIYFDYFLYAGFGIITVLSILSAIGKIHLLRNGVAATAQVLEAIPYGGTSSFSNTPGSGNGSGPFTTMYRGWGESVEVSPGSQKFKQRLRLTGANNKFHEFWYRGFKYKAEIYLFDPNAPKRHIRASKYRAHFPPKKGKWHVWPLKIKFFLIQFFILLVVCAGALVYFSGMLPRLLLALIKLF
jgi:hypothetical protein